MKERYGPCSLCGAEGKLSFEHVPPESAFNDRSVLYLDIKRLIGGSLFEALENPRGRESQRGAGRYTLCSDCNSKTGSWYAKDYVEFAHQAYDLVHRVPTELWACACFRIKPLNVLKQLLVMCCSACGPGFAAAHPGLARRLLNRDARDLSPDVSVFLALYDPKTSLATRQSGLTGRLSPDGSHAYAEIAFPPFISIFVPGGDGPPDERLYSINFFRDFAYAETAEIWLRLFSLPVSTYFPADFRSADQVKGSN